MRATRTRRPTFRAAACVSMLLVVGCGSDDDEGGVVGTDAPSEAPASDPPATDPPDTVPLATDPPATDPEQTDQSAADPPTTDSGEGQPPDSEPPATDSPASEPASSENLQAGFYERVLAASRANGAFPGDIGDRVPVFEGGTPPGGDVGGFEIIDAIRVRSETNIDALAPLTSGAATWTIIRPYSPSYFENVGQVDTHAFELSGNPFECAGFCGITLINDAGDGESAIEPGVGIPLFLDGTKEFLEISVSNGAVIDLFGSSDGGSLAEFSNPFDARLNSSAAGEFLVVTTTADFVDRIVVSGLDSTNPLEAYSNSLSGVVSEPASEQILDGDIYQEFMDTHFFKEPD